MENVDKFYVKKHLLDFWRFEIKPRLSISGFIRLIGCLLVGILVLSTAVYAAGDTNFASDLARKGSWWILIEKEYFKNLVFSPVWVVAGILFSAANRLEKDSWQKSKTGLLGFLKDKQQVYSADVLEFLVGEYNPNKEYEAQQQHKTELLKAAKGAAASEQKIT